MTLKAVPAGTVVPGRSKLIKLTMIHAYAPTNDAEDVTKEDFYGKLQEVAEQVHKHDVNHHWRHECKGV